MSADDIIKMILAGANCVQLASALYRKGVGCISDFLTAIDKWMEQKGYENIDAIRGTLSHKSGKDPWAYTRAQYAKLLLRPQKVFAE
jgi:dihydroorotate dehydrogenase (fumarate)